MEPLKNFFNKNSVEHLAVTLQKVIGKSFDSKLFQESINQNLPALEMKDRVRLISKCLNKYLPYDYENNVEVLKKILSKDSSKVGINGFQTWPLLQYVEDFGLQNFEVSFGAMYEMTQRFSAEFAIRPFLNADDKKVFKILQSWQFDSNLHVRRLCSEGIRPNLPWGLKVPVINENLERNLQILDNLKDDQEEYVRRSVANHLNDISRLNQKYFLKILKGWSRGRFPPRRKFVIRHAARTLLKKGHPEVLKIHGYDANAKFEIKNLKINRKQIVEGDKLKLSFELFNESKAKQKILLDYKIYFRKGNGTLSPKAFRLKDSQIEAGESLKFEKVIHFKKITTRKYYLGLHKISLQVNGQESKFVQFHLK